MFLFQHITEIIESFFTILAIIVGGIWTYIIFIKNREKYPKAVLKHNVDTVDIEDGLLIRLRIEIENLGKVILPIKTGEIRLQQIKPSTKTVSEAIENFQNDVNEKKADIIWPLLEKRILKYEADQTYELEPGEIDYFEFDFILSNEIDVIQFYTHIENDLKQNKGWNYTSIHNLN